METSKNKLWDVDTKLFASMRENSLTPNEFNFFKNMQFKEEYEPTLSNDLIISEHDNADEIYLVRVEYDEYLVGHGTVDHRDEELHVMNLSEALYFHFIDIMIQSLYEPSFERLVDIEPL